MAAKKHLPTDKVRDRFLQKRADGGFRYRRRVPDRFVAAVGARWVRHSLKTADLAVARARRDAQEAADDAFWASLAADGEAAAARAQYDAARARAVALGFAYRPAAEIAAAAPLEEIVARVEAALRLGGGASHGPAAARDVDALFGLVAAPETTISEAFAVYVDQIAAAQKASKSPGQYASWLKVKKRALANFIGVVGDLPVAAIGRADAQKFHKHWQARVAAGEVGVNRAERDFGNLRALWRDYMTFIDRPDAPNPFRNLGFGKERTQSRPPFPTDWIRDVILKPGALGGLNPEARAVLLIMIETGARPSEICNLRPGQILLDADIPRLRIEAAAGVEIKADASRREIPLLGAALVAATAFPNGFPRYFDKATSWSNAVNKYMRQNGLIPAEPRGCSAYSFRHSFEDRLKEAGIDYALRCQFMGHADDRPKYGGGGALSWRRDELARIILPFDPAALLD